jgi:DNA-binding MarR family transcriptional regulator
MIVLWEQDGITVGDISARLLTDPGSLTPLLQRLEAEGLLRRTRGKDDERVLRLYLKAQGETLREKAPEHSIEHPCRKWYQPRAIAEHAAGPKQSARQSAR